MKFAVAFIPEMPAAEVVDLAELAERLAYDCLWLPDQRFFRDPFVLLGLCAQATRRITLGLAVTNPYTRHPLQIARAAASVDEVAGGRFILGLGAGNRSKMLSSLAIDSSRAIQRIEECVTVCRRLFRGERVTYQSPTLTLEDVALDFPARPDIPIYVASRSPGILEMGGRVADGVLMEALFTPGGLAYGLDRITRGAAMAGRDSASVRRISWQSAYLADESDAANEPRFRQWAGLVIHGTQDAVLEKIGIPSEVIAHVREDFAAYGEAGIGQRVPPEIVGNVLMVGTPTQLSHYAETLRAHDIDMMSMIILGGTSEVRDTLRRFAAEVMTPLRRRSAEVRGIQ